MFLRIEKEKKMEKKNWISRSERSLAHIIYSAP